MLQNGKIIRCCREEIRARGRCHDNHGTVIGERECRGADFYVRTMVLVEYYSESEIINLKKEQGDDIGTLDMM